MKLYGCFRKWWYPQIIQFNRVFHYKPSILGYPYFRKHPYVSHTTFQYYGLLRTFATPRVQRTSFGGRIQVSWNTSVYDHAIIHVRVSHSESTNMSALIPTNHTLLANDTSNKASRSMVCSLVNWPSYVDRSWRTIWELPALFTLRPRSHGAGAPLPLTMRSTLMRDFALKRICKYLSVIRFYCLDWLGKGASALTPFQTCS